MQLASVDCNMPLSPLWGLVCGRNKILTIAHLHLYVGVWDRFILTVEAVAAASAFTGPTRGWPDLDLIGGQWLPQQEQLRVSFIATVGAPLFLSWDVRNSSASTLPLEAYLNPELIAIHQVNALCLGLGW